MDADPYTSDERRRLLDATDHLLEQIEQLRLRDVIHVPEQLRTRMAAVAGEIREGPSPSTLAAAHDHVFRLQWLLLRGPEDRASKPGPKAASAGGIQPLSIPSRGSESEADWLERVRLVVQRAHDRALYLYAQAQAAEQMPDGEGRPLASKRGAQAKDAHEAFQRISREAELTTGRAMTLDTAPSVVAGGRIEVADLAIDIDEKQVHQAGRPVQLTRREHALLSTLAANQDRVITREALQHLVNGDEPTLELTSRTLDVHLASIRAKLGHPPYLETVRDIGYRAAVRSDRSKAPMSGQAELRGRRTAERRAAGRASTASAPATPTSPPVKARRLSK